MQINNVPIETLRNKLLFVVLSPEFTEIQRTSARQELESRFENFSLDVARDSYDTQASDYAQLNSESKRT